MIKRILRFISLISTILLLAPMTAHGVQITISPVVLNTAQDDGPQDGVFDQFRLPPNDRQVNNNGFIDIRIAFEFPLSSLPVDSVVNSAVLRFGIAAAEGPRDIQVNGYAGDGSIQLTDFAQDGLIGATTVGPGGSTPTVGGIYIPDFDATAFITNLVDNGDPFAGFNVREFPANLVNFTIMGAPVSNDVCQCPLELLIDYSSPSTSVTIDIKPGDKKNTINPRSKGNVRVAVLSNIDPESPFDPLQVDITTVQFGPDGAQAIRQKVKDVNKDGLGDLLLRFKIPQTGIACGDTQATLTGETFAGESFTGTDDIVTRGCVNNQRQLRKLRNLLKKLKRQNQQKNK